MWTQRLPVSRTSSCPTNFGVQETFEVLSLGKVRVDPFDCFVRHDRFARTSSRSPSKCSRSLLLYPLLGPARGSYSKPMACHSRSTESLDQDLSKCLDVFTRKVFRDEFVAHILIIREDRVMFGIQLRLKRGRLFTQGVALCNPDAHEPDRDPMRSTQARARSDPSIWISRTESLAASEEDRGRSGLRSKVYGKGVEQPESAASGCHRGRRSDTIQTDHSTVLGFRRIRSESGRRSMRSWSSDATTPALMAKRRIVL